MKKSESIAELSKALAKFQENVKQPFKDKANPFFKSKYVPLESVVEAITQEAPKHGLSFVQWALMKEQGKDVAPEQVNTTLGITDFTQLTSDDVKQAITKLKGWSK